MKIDWNFPSNNNAEIAGIGESGIETFKGNPIRGLAREICQNSIDATKENKTTKIEFVSFRLPSKKLLGVDTLTDALLRGKDFWKGQRDTRARDFYEDAIDTIKSDYIDFLRISDFNTTGLIGSRSNSYNTSWSNLIKSTGVSDKLGGAGGSFGIGKNAPFATSSLRTIFYSTLDIENVKACQGVSRLTSFKDPMGDTTFGVGYYGGENNTPIYNLVTIDPNYDREKQGPGTDIYISGFQYAHTDWKSEIIKSVLDGFLYSIYEGTLEVRINDILINRQSIDDLIEKYIVPDDSAYRIVNYYKVLTSNSKWVEESNFMNMGKIKLKLDIEQGFHKRVAMIRKTGMKIFDRGHISNVIPFAGVLIIEGEKINNFLRQIENPTHTKWEPERAGDKIPYAREVLKAFGKFITKVLNELSESSGSEFIDPDVGEFLPDEPQENIDDNKQKQESLDKIISSTEKRKVGRIKKPLNIASDIIDNNEESLDGDGEDYGISGFIDYSNENSKSKNPLLRGAEGEGEDISSPQSKSSSVPIGASKERVICIDKNIGEYAIWFTPNRSVTEGELAIYMSAETQNYEAELLEVSCIGCQGLSFDKNKIMGLEFIKDEVLRFKVKIDYKDYCSLEVKAYATKI